MKKWHRRNLYAQKISQSQYYPDLCKNADEFIANERINLGGVNRIRYVQQLKKNIEEAREKEMKKGKK